ncbi:MAG: hypothetical protein CMK74_17480, partial [Pseudomonadales bacterium]|nr:hypothetical protein [Pseudomonadales bacterium]
MSDCFLDFLATAMHAQARAASSDRGSEWSTVRNMKDPLREIRSRYYGAAGAAVNAGCTATPARPLDCYLKRL